MVLSFNTELPWEKCNPNWKQKSNLKLDSFFRGKIIKSYYYKDCFDSSNWSGSNFTSCEGEGFLKCNDGVCYDSMTIHGTPAFCNSTQGTLNQVGFWQRSYPSEIFWK